MGMRDQIRRRSRGGRNRSTRSGSGRPVRRRRSRSRTASRRSGRGRGTRFTLPANTSSGRSGSGRSAAGSTRRRPRSFRGGPTSTKRRTSRRRPTPRASSPPTVHGTPAASRSPPGWCRRSTPRGTTDGGHPQLGLALPGLLDAALLFDVRGTDLSGHLRGGWLGTLRFGLSERRCRRERSLRLRCCFAVGGDRTSQLARLARPVAHEHVGY